LLLLGSVSTGPAFGADTTPGVTVAIREKGRPEQTVRLTSICLVVDADPGERRAAAELARYLQQMTGTALPVRELNGVPAKESSLWVGRVAEVNGWISRKELAACSPDGFVIKQGPYGLAIAGGSSRGTLYGAYRLLEDMGVQFYSGRVPNTPVPVLPYALKKDKPFFELRTLCTETYGSGSLDSELGNPQPLADQSIASSLWFDHTQGFLVPLNRYWKEHPEYYAQCDWLTALRAQDKIPAVNRVWVCMSNPQVWQIAGDTLLDWIKQQPDRRFFSVQCGDSRGNYCRCANCQAVGNVSDNLLAFTNALAKRVKVQYPDKYLLIFAYQDTLAPPLKVKPDANVIVLYAPYQRPDIQSRIHSFLSGPMNHLAREGFDRWYKVAPRNMGTYEYNFSVYLPALDKMITQIKEYAKRGMHGIFYCGNTSMMSELFLYMNAKLLWDPFQDDRKLIREFCDGFYGKAGPTMTELVALIRAQVRKPGVAFPPGTDEGMTLETAQKWARESSFGKAFYTPEFCRQASALLAQAEQAVRNEPVELQRVRTVRGQLVGLPAPEETGAALKDE